VNLSEFLLARIAEDEVVAQEWPDDRQPPPNGDALWMDALGHAIYQPRARVLAECDSKRRLIYACTHEVENWVTIRPGVRQNMPVRMPWGDDDLYEDALKFLALPYADHPDYDPAWRP